MNNTALRRGNGEKTEKRAVAFKTICVDILMRILQKKQRF